LRGQDVLRTIISNLVEGWKIEVAKFSINKIVDPNLKNSLEQSYFDKINVLKAQNLRAEASEFARQMAERLRKGQTIDWNLAEQKIRDYSPDSKKLQRDFVL